MIFQNTYHFFQQTRVHFFVALLIIHMSTIIIKLDERAVDIILKDQKTDMKPRKGPPQLDIT